MTTRNWTVYLFSSLMLTCFSAGRMTAQEEAGDRVITFEVGSIRITTLCESSQDGNSQVLKGATPEMIRTYLSDGKYPAATNAFLLRTADRHILVDAGYGRRLFENLEAQDVTPGQIDVILLTHMHGDHIGGLLRDGQATFPKAALYLSQAEHDFWTDDQAMQQAGPDRQGGFVQARKVIAAYKDRLHLFPAAELNGHSRELLPGIRGIAAYGHTPGHTAFLIESEDEELLIWGDLTHAMAIQMPCPEVALVYDSDPGQAVETRKKMLEYVAENKIPVAGMHIPFPAIGNIARAKDKADGYTYTPFCLCLEIREGE
jgi:glyoxylase-like metal-dependent hydrolase (beta-lactamase superfamily II)